jgi:endonuclease-3
MTISKKEKATIVAAYLAKLFPTAGCELNYRQDYELVIAVMLSAQTTDASVNRVTAILFNHYPTLASLALAPILSIEQDIRSIGLYRHKAENVHLIAQQLLNEFQGIVPASKEQLMRLPGVGNKTANVVRAELFHLPEFAVDTHVARVSRRLGLTSVKDNVDQIEKKLRKLYSPEDYIQLHHRFIHFGRYFCKAQKPHCYECQLVDICLEKNKNYQSE